MKAVRLQGEQYWTIGYGHYGADVAPNQTMTPAQAEALLRKDLTQFEAWVSQYAPWPVNQNEFDALVSFTYNCGPGSLQQLVRGRTKAQVAEAMLHYTKSASPAFTQGLLNRRRKERALFLESTEGEETMTGKEIYDALQEYLGQLIPPKGVQTELAAAQAAGIWDGTEPSGLSLRWMNACMAWRACKEARSGEPPSAPILALVQKIHELECAKETLEKENRELRDEIAVLHSDVHTANGY